MADVNKEPEFIVSLRKLGETLSIMQRQINEVVMLFGQYGKEEKSEGNVVPTLSSDIIESAVQRSPLPKPVTVQENEPSLTMIQKGILKAARVDLGDVVSEHVPSDKPTRTMTEYKPENDPLKKGDLDALPSALQDRLFVPLGTYLARFTRGRSITETMLEMDKLHAAEFLTFMKKIGEWISDRSFYSRNGADDVPILAQRNVKFSRDAYVLTSAADHLARTTAPMNQNQPRNLNEAIVAYIAGRAWLQGGAMTIPEDAPAEFKLAKDLTENVLLKSASVTGHFVNMIQDHEGWLSRLIRNYFGSTVPREFHIALNTPWEKNNIHNIYLVISSVAMIYAVSDFYIKVLANEKETAYNTRLASALESVYNSIQHDFTWHSPALFKFLKGNDETEGIPVANIEDKEVEKLYVQTCLYMAILDRISNGLKDYDDPEIVNDLARAILVVLFGNITTAVTGRRRENLDGAWRKISNLKYINDKLREEIEAYIQHQSYLDEGSLMSLVLQYMYKPSDAMSLLESMTHDNVTVEAFEKLLKGIVCLSKMVMHTRAYMAEPEDGQKNDVEATANESLKSAVETPPATEVPQEVVDVVTPSLGSSAVGEQSVEDAINVLGSFLGGNKGEEFRKSIQAQIDNRTRAKEKVDETVKEVPDNASGKTFTDPLFDISRPEFLKELGLAFSGEICNQYIGKVRPSSLRSSLTYRVYNEDLLTHYRQVNNEWPDGFYKDQDTGDYQFLLKLSADIYIFILFRTQAELAQIIRYNVQNNAVPFDEVENMLMTQLAMISGR